ncbi:mucin-2-like [Physella acuta]|uniref:mucin-2-like n=1 Tax=Physella acuta TaxID=109671 RepID=UPI0027DD09CF|nr:mucin-2-like [Physella acuta]
MDMLCRLLCLVMLLHHSYQDCSSDKPTTITCDPPAMLMESYKLNLVCRVQSSSSLISCFINVTINGVSDPHVVSRSDVLDKTCTNLVSVVGVPPGQLELSVTVYPQGCDSSLYGVKGQRQQVTLKSPEVKPLTCVSSEFPQYAEAVCTCYLSDAGFPPGYAQWYTADGNKTGTLNVTDGSATFRQILASVADVSVECRAFTVLQTTQVKDPRLVFVATVVFGPTYLELNAPNPYSICPDSAGLTIDCSAKYYMTNREPIFIAQLGSVRTNRTLAPYVIDKYYFHPTFKIDSPGNYILYCRAENKVFPQIFAESSMTVMAIEPPSTAPLLYTSKHPPNSGKFSVQVNIGDSLDVTCVVDGGQPAVTSVTMTCFSNTTTVAGNSLTMRIAIDVITIRFSCTCQAAHVTNCYYLKSQMVFTGPLTTTEKPQSATSVSTEQKVPFVTTEHPRTTTTPTAVLSDFTSSTTTKTPDGSGQSRPIVTTVTTVVGNSNVSSTTVTKVIEVKENVNSNLGLIIGVAVAAGTVVVLVIVIVVVYLRRRGNKPARGDQSTAGDMAAVGDLNRPSTPEQTAVPDEELESSDGNTNRNRARRDEPRNGQNHNASSTAGATQDVNNAAPRLPTRSGTSIISQRQPPTTPTAGTNNIAQRQPPTSQPEGTSNIAQGQPPNTPTAGINNIAHRQPPTSQPEGTSNIAQGQPSTTPTAGTNNIAQGQPPTTPPAGTNNIAQGQPPTTPTAGTNNIAQGQPPTTPPAGTNNIEQGQPPTTPTAGTNNIAQGQPPTTPTAGINNIEQGQPPTAFPQNDPTCMSMSEITTALNLLNESDSSHPRHA